ncbi:DUF4124 domain-containing protein [Curvibacter sp. APW13]|uniref:DUF4124 domain-containing protein n=1 Tax=Curvibacter sp. APW13 TaxID=3077236 RepID=UPI0028DF174C|nr:DUF4124 domain-containing protein [Curvibacter sp. APW13]MDT8991346.1 DUF4124 domain-containing protein [Curvibacter sp. APW13]
MRYARLFPALLVALFCVAAQAQWQWLDRDGRKVFSDRAPPPDVPEKNILKRPGKSPAPAPDAEASSATVSAPSLPAPAPKKSELDLKLEEKKKQAEQAEAAKKKAEEERIAKARAESCDRARRAKATFDTGVRISTQNANGEREFMDEASRAAEEKRIQSVIAADCR